MANLKWYTHKIRNFQALFSLIKCYLPNPSFHNSLSMGPVEDGCYGRRSGGKKYLDYSLFLHTKVSMEGEINMSEKKYDANVARELKASFAVLLKKNYFFFSLSPPNKKIYANIFAVREHAKMQYIDL